MANTTFSGPVRSENGFQEWNGTEWVPVAGGNVAVLASGEAYSLPENPEVGTTITIVSAPYDGVEWLENVITVTVPAGEIGLLTGYYYDTGTSAMVNYTNSGVGAVSLPDPNFAITCTFAGTILTGYGVTHFWILSSGFASGMTVPA